MKRTFHLFLWLLTPIIFSPMNTAQAWEPTKPIEFVIPAGTGGGADQMAPLLGHVADKRKHPLRRVNAIKTARGDRAEGFDQERREEGEDHSMIIALPTL